MSKSPIRSVGGHIESNTLDVCFSLPKGANIELLVKELEATVEAHVPKLRAATAAFARDGYVSKEAVREALAELDSYDVEACGAVPPISRLRELIE